MVIKHLPRFVESIPEAWEDVKLMKGRGKEAVEAVNVAIHGDGLVSKFYYVGSLSAVSGGDYGQYAQLLKTYLARNSKSPFSIQTVFFQGLPINRAPSQAKEDAPCKDLNIFIPDKTELANTVLAIKNQKFKDLKLLPPLAQRVLTYTLTQMKMGVTMCDDSPTKALAAICRSKGMLVISHDTDLYLMDTPGYVPLSTLRIYENMVVMKKFSQEKFLKHIGLDKSFLPLYASLLSNEFLPSKLVDTFHTFVLKGKQPTDIFMQLASYLSQFSSPQEALEKVKSFEWLSTEETTESFDKDLFVKSVEQALDYFTTPTDGSDLASISLENTTLTPYLAEGESKPTEHSFPEEFIKNMRSGMISSRTLMAATHAICTFPIIVEDFDKPSSTNPAKEIRRLVYRALFASPDRPNPSNIVVKEYTRVGTEFVSVNVTPSDAKVPSIYDKLDRNERAETIFSLLHSQASIMKGIGEELKFATAALRFFIKSSTPKLTASEIATIVMGIARSSTLFSKGPLPPPNWLSPRAMAVFAQWQMVLDAASSLNEVMYSPFPNFDISNIFDGSFAHTCFNDIQKTTDVFELVGKRCSLDTFKKVYDYATLGLGEYISGKLPTPQAASQSREALKSKAKKNVFDLLEGDDDEEEEVETQSKGQKKGSQKETKVEEEDNQASGELNDDDWQKLMVDKQTRSWADEDDEGPSEPAAVEAEESKEEEEEEEVEKEEEEKKEKKEKKPKQAPPPPSADKKKKKLTKEEEEIAALMSEIESVDRAKKEKEQKQKEKKKEKKAAAKKK